MDPLQTIILGIIQGITEWLPISSTGHLKIAEHLMSLKMPLQFDITLHIGTLIVTLLFFHKDIKNILAALSKRDFKTENGKLIPLITIGTIPTALIGIILSNNTTESLLSSFPAMAIEFTIMGITLYCSKLGTERKENITYTQALAIGAAQGIAIIPAISRSGMTIAIALLLGIKREKAFKFSFLLSVPAVIGALGLTFYEQRETLILAGVGFAEILVGVAVTIVISLLALKLLWRILAGKKLYLFAFYCWIIGIVLLALSLSGF
jgi:undecaprenyl-diphosphatase